MADSGRSIVVVGEGSAAGTPDRCELTIGLNVLADTPAGALEEVARLADAVTQVLHDREIPAADIQTLNVTVQDWFDQKEQRVTARVASYVLTVLAERVNQAGPLLAALAPVAGDALRLHGIELRLADVEPLLQVARTRAMDDARNRATQLAEAAGLRLGPVVTIEEASAPGHFPGFARRAAAGVAASMQSVAVEPGSHRVSVRVIVAYAIDDAV